MLIKIELFMANGDIYIGDCIGVLRKEKDIVEIMLPDKSVMRFEGDITSLVVEGRVYGASTK